MDKNNNKMIGIFNFEPRKGGFWWKIAVLSPINPQFIKICKNEISRILWKGNAEGALKTLRENYQRAKMSLS